MRWPSSLMSSRIESTMSAASYTARYHCGITADIFFCEHPNVKIETRRCNLRNQVCQDLLRCIADLHLQYSDGFKHVTAMFVLLAVPMRYQHAMQFASIKNCEPINALLKTFGGFLLWWLLSTLGQSHQNSNR